jgi:hypothetical protein
MQYAMLNEASGTSDAPRLAKWQSIMVRAHTRAFSFQSPSLRAPAFFAASPILRAYFISSEESAWPDDMRACLGP